MIKLIVTDVDGTLVEDGFTNVDPRKTLGQCGTYL